MRGVPVRRPPFDDLKMICFFTSDRQRQRRMISEKDDNYDAACSRFFMIGRMIPRAVRMQGVTILRPIVKGSVS